MANRLSRKRARELGRLGGQAKAAKMRAAKGAPAPFAGSILDMMDAAELTGPSWAAWRTFWRVITGLPLSDADLLTFTRCTGRRRVPAGPLREAWLVVGRRGGKSRNAALAALYAGIRRDYHHGLPPGERVVIPVIAADRKQARQVLGYLKGLGGLPVFAPYVARVLKEAVELRTGVTVEIHTAAYTTTRGYTIAGVVCDELAFWRSKEEGANPDGEILTALRPGMATVPGALLLGLSTPYAPKGELFKAFERFYGRDEADDALVWRATSLDMNPALDSAVVQHAYDDDPVAAASEYGAEWRRDVEVFLDPEAVRAVTVRDRRELPPAESLRYVAFVDPSGGSSDAFTLAIAHREGERAVLDVVRETRPPFSPESVVAEYAALLQKYRIYHVTGDRYAGEWPRERFALHGIRYLPIERTKSDLYRELLPAVNACCVELLDLPRLAAQLVGLERHVARSGKDTIDHAPGGHDDVANAVAGALVTRTASVFGPPLVSKRHIRPLFARPIEPKRPAASQ